jgi:hypothetical protein
MPKARWFVIAFLAGGLLRIVMQPAKSDSEIEKLTMEEMLASLAAEAPPPEPDFRTAGEIIAGVAAYYAECHSYSDSGDVETIVTYPDQPLQTRSAHFRTNFTRPDRFRFEYSKPMEHRFVAWRDGKDVRTGRDSPPSGNKEPSFKVAMMGAAEYSDGCAYLISSLLEPDENDNQWLLGMSEVAEISKMAGDNLGDELKIARDGRSANLWCVINGCIGDREAEIWIDKRKLLIRKIALETDFSDRHVSQEFNYRPEIDEFISKSSQAFTGRDDSSSPELARLPVRESTNTAQNEPGIAWGGVELRGRPEYRACISEALELLFNRDRESLLLILNHISLIEEEGPHGIWPIDNNPVLGLPQDPACYSPTYCAAMLVYFAQQARLYTDYKNRFGPPVPEEIWMGGDIDSLCRERAMNVLLKIGGPQDQIAYLSYNGFSLITPKRWDLVAKQVRK